MISGEEMKSWPPKKRLAVLKAEMEGRLAALEGGAAWEEHGKHIRWIAAEIYEITGGK